MNDQQEKTNVDELKIMIHDLEEEKRQSQTRIHDLEEEKRQSQTRIHDLEEEKRQSQKRIHDLEEEKRQIQIVRKYKHTLLVQLKNFICKKEPLTGRRIPHTASVLPRDILQRATEWMRGRNNELLQQSCNANAKLCWALIAKQQYDENWVQCPTQNDYRNGVVHIGYEKARKLKDAILSNHRSMVLIRFLNATEDDGHSLILYKYDDSIYTFQAYQNVQTLKLYEFDCSIGAFDCAINHSNPKLGPCSFGIESTDSEWNIADYCCMYEMIL